MAKTSRTSPRRGRNATIVLPVVVDFETALGALLKTPPQKKAAAKKRAAKKQ